MIVNCEQCETWSKKTQDSIYLSLFNLWILINICHVLYTVCLFTQVKLYSWSSFDAVCSLESNVTTIKAGVSTLVFQHPLSALLTQCGNCTRRSCIVTFHLSNPEGQMISPHNHVFLSSPRHAEGLQKPNITVRETHSQHTPFTNALTSANSLICHIAKMGFFTNRVWMYWM